jgi:hypothetical protein
VISLVRVGRLPQQGCLKQEDVPLAAFFSTPTGRLLAG